jgi:lipoprotein-releasing system permease protein
MMLKMPDIFMPLSLAQGLSGLGDGVQGIALKVEDPYRLANVLPSLMENLPPGWYLSTWEEQFESFFNIINQQRVMMYFVLSFIILISSFSMMAVMFTVTIQKKREIGVMKALGATPGQILGVFVYQGAILGAIGSLLGVVFGLGIIAIRGKLIGSLRVFGFDPFPAKISGFDILPAVVNPSELLLIFSMGLVLCIFASFVPAWFAARSDAAKSLRNI